MALLVGARRDDFNVFFWFCVQNIEASIPPTTPRGADEVSRVFSDFENNESVCGAEKYHVEKV